MATLCSEVYLLTASSQNGKVVDNSASLQKATFRIADGNPILPIAASREDDLGSGILSPILQLHPARILQLFEDATPHCREGPFGDDIDTSATETLPRSWRYKYYKFKHPVVGHYGFRLVQFLDKLQRLKSATIAAHVGCCLVKGLCKPN